MPGRTLSGRLRKCQQGQGKGERERGRSPGEIDVHVLPPDEAPAGYSSVAR